MRLTTWAKEQGISYLTAWRWCKQGKMPCGWERAPSGMILVHPEQRDKTLPTYVYARVSSHDKKSDLERQRQRCLAFCAASGWSVDTCLTEVASGMNDSRRQLSKLFDLPPGRLVVEHKDRLTRFGFNYIEVLLSKLGWEMVVINRADDDRDDLMKDLVAIITSFCCRLHGLRRGQRKAMDIRKQCEEPAS